MNDVRIKLYARGICNGRRALRVRLDTIDRAPLTRWTKR